MSGGLNTDSPTEPLTKPPTEPLTKPPTEPAPDLAARLAAARTALGDKVAVVAHLYQSEDIVAVADKVGDALALARLARDLPGVESIVFCGVRSLAEGLVLMARPDQKVYLPAPEAGCDLEAAASAGQVSEALAALAMAGGANGAAGGKVLPVGYLNSSLEVKAEVGRAGGALCTAANAVSVVKAVLKRADRALFVTDRNTGLWAGRSLGLESNEMVVWDPGSPPTNPELENARLVIWNGCCKPHREYALENWESIVKDYPGVRLVAHAECDPALHEVADLVGSSGQLAHRVRKAPPGTIWAVATESIMVRRLQDELTDRTILQLAPGAGQCPYMAEITLLSLVECLEALAGLAGDRPPAPAPLELPPELAEPALAALQRMLDWTGG